MSTLLLPRNPSPCPILLPVADCGLFHKLYGVPTVALHYFNVFGPRQDPGSEYSAVIPRFITAIKAGRRPVVLGDGEQSRDFTFIADVVQANLVACTAGSDALGGAYNIACGGRISLNGLLEVLGEIGSREVRADQRIGTPSCESAGRAACAGPMRRSGANALTRRSCGERHAVLPRHAAGARG